MIHQQKLKVLLNKKIRDGFYHIRFASAAIARSALAGQFVQIRVNDTFDPLLRRPLGIHRVDKGTFDCLYTVVGKATQILSQVRTGVSVDVVGPLGQGFNYTLTANRSTPILIAGGMGVAPLVFLAERFAALRKGAASGPLQVIIGARTKSHILCLNEFRKFKCQVHVATEDGTAGSKGYATDVLEDVLSTDGCRLTTMYACGPHPMLAAVASLARKRGIAAQVSLEAHMSCGIGACLGCVVETTHGQKRVCKEGPVFSAQEVIW